MINISTSYMGLKLANPVIIGSCGLTDKVNNIVDRENNGAGAVVLKSIFEEEVNLEYEMILKEADPLGYQQEAKDSAIFERVQFMKFFSGKF